MAPLRISSPSAAAALLLVDLLSDNDATATQHADGHWEITVPLAGANRAVVPQTLAVARAWLDQCGIYSASVTFDGHTHLLHGERQVQMAMH
jgi:hypothetical protein